MVQRGPTARHDFAGFDDDATEVFPAVGAGAAPPGGTRAGRHGPPPRRRRSLAFRVVRALAVALVLLVAGAGGMAYGIQEKLADQIGTVDVGYVGGNRPVAAVPKALNILVIGLDKRTSGGKEVKWVAGEQRSDSMMLVHAAEDRKSVDVVSIPRDSWVDIPGNGKAKINAAYSLGGPPLLIQTIEQLTGVRIDHLAMIDFAGFKDMTDALGGVTITVPKAVHDEKRFFPAGTYRMDGKRALDYVRQRHGLPASDFSRMKRQQNWTRAVIKQALSKDTLTSPTKLMDFLTVATRSVAVDEGWKIEDLRDLGLSLKDLQTGDIRFLTAPNVGSDEEDGQDIVRLDDVNGPALYAAIANDQTTAWFQANRPETLGDTVD